MSYPSIIPVKVKIEGRGLYVWWAGKWRPMCYYAHNRKWNEKWVKTEVLRTLRCNVPLPVEVDIEIKREEN